MIYVIRTINTQKFGIGYLRLGNGASIYSTKYNAIAFDDSVDAYDDICAKYLRKNIISGVEKIKLYDIDELMDL